MTPAPYELKNCAFIHIPKTGGSWIHNALRDQGLLISEGIGHATKKELGIEKPCFCFVRHPVLWLKSIWAFQRRRFDLERECLLKEELYQRYQDQIREGKLNFLSLTYCYDDNINIFFERVLDSYENAVVDYFDHYSRECMWHGRHESMYTDLASILTAAREKFDQKKLHAYSENKINVCGSDIKVKISSKHIRELQRRSEQFMKKYDYAFIESFGKKEVEI